MQERDWIEHLACGGPTQFEDAWLRLSNGELWRLCCEDNKEVLGKLHNQLIASHQGFIERLEWWLDKIGLPKRVAYDIFHQMKSLVEDFLYKDGGEWSEYIDQFGDEEIEIPQVTLQGLGVKGRDGFVVNLKLDLREDTEPKPRLVPHPESILLPQDDEFKAALSKVEQWMQSFSPVGIKIVWRITRSDGHPLDALRGNSLSGLFAVGIWLLLKDFPPDPSITITAALSDDGKLIPVSGLVEKVRAAINLSYPQITCLLVAKGQDLSTVSNLPGLPQDFFQQVATVDEAIDAFQTRIALFVDLRNKMARMFDHFYLIGLGVGDWSCYQEPSVTLSSKGRKSLLLTDWLREWLRGEQKHWLLVARSGMGKSTALRYIAYLLSSKGEYKNLLPVFLEAKEWLSVWEKLRQFSFNPSLSEILKTFFSKASPNELEDKHWANWLERGHIVLLVDQVEQVATKHDFVEHIRDTLEGNNSLRVVLAVRSERFEDFKWLGLPSIHLEPLSKDQAQHLLVKLSSVLDRPVPALPPQMSEFPPFLIVASLFLPHPIKGLGRTYLELVKALLSKVGSPLPPTRMIEILGDVFMALEGKDSWDNDEVYDELRKCVGDAQRADDLWGILRASNLLVEEGKLLRPVHTLLVEALRAFSLAQKWNRNFPVHEADRLLTSTRTLLLASLLDQQVAQDFWRWLQRRVMAEPLRWAETCAYCLSERDDAPTGDFVNLFYSRWFDAFQRGKKEEEQAWGSAIAASPERAICDYVLPKAHQLLQGKPKLADLRAATNLMAIVSDKVAFDSQIVDALVSAFIASEFKRIVAQDIAKLFGPPLQTESLRHFIDRLLTYAERSRQGFDALEEFVKVAQFPQNLGRAVADRLRLLEQNIQSGDLRKRLHRLLGYFHSVGS
jgi:hypothetical protein